MRNCEDQYTTTQRLKMTELGTKESGSRQSTSTLDCRDLLALDNVEVMLDIVVVFGVSDVVMVVVDISLSSSDMFVQLVLE